MRLRSNRALVGLLFFLGLGLSGRAADFSIVFAGAPRYCLLRDINRGTNGYLDFWVGLSELSGGVATENRNPMHFVMNYSVDFTLPLDSEYSLALGVGLFRIQSASDVHISFPNGQPDASALVETRVDAVPIKLSAIRIFHLTRSLNAFIEGGVAVYSARYRSSYWPAGPGDSHVQDAHAIGIGIICGGGLEIKASKHLGLVIKAQGDYARIGGFKGTRNSAGSTPPHEEKGILYFEETTIYSPPGVPRVYPLLMIHEDRPPTALRQARIDISGFSLLVGMKISL